MYSRGNRSRTSEHQGVCEQETLDTITRLTQRDDMSSVDYFVNRSAQPLSNCLNLPISSSVKWSLPLRILTHWSSMRRSWNDANHTGKCRLWVDLVVDSPLRVVDNSSPS